MDNRRGDNVTEWEKKKGMKKIIAFGLVLGVVLLSVVMYLTGGGEKEAPVKEASKPVPIGGAFVLTDTNGAVVRDSDFRGKLLLVYFGFTYCPDVCPLGLSTISQVMALLGPKQSRVQPLFITVDPERDTPEQMRSYMAHFSPAIKGLTGTKEQIQAVTAAYRVYYNKAPEGKGTGYLIDHSSFIYLMDREGRYIAHFASNAAALQIAQSINRAL